METQKKKPSVKIERLVNDEELSSVTGLTVAYIKVARLEQGLPYYKIGKSVKFKVSDVFEWAEKRKCAS